jgi:hypothetical protein
MGLCMVFNAINRVLPNIGQIELFTGVKRDPHPAICRPGDAHSLAGDILDAARVGAFIRIIDNADLQQFVNFDKFGLHR